jgi:hypothetical protein
VVTIINKSICFTLINFDDIQAWKLIVKPIIHVLTICQAIKNWTRSISTDKNDLILINCLYIYYILFFSYTYIPLSTVYWPIVPATDDGYCVEIGGMKTGRGNRSTRRKPAPVLISPPQIPHVLTRARIRTAEEESKRLTAWALLRRGYSKGNRSIRALSDCQTRITMWHFTFREICGYYCKGDELSFIS